MMSDLQSRLTDIESQLQIAADRYHTPKPLLLAVSKKHPATAIRRLYELGIRAFGESYVQEAIRKQQELANLTIDWHFIGPIQSNKTKEIANHFHWVHSVDRIKIAKRLSEQRHPEQGAINICVQINLDGEESKSGITLQEAHSFCKQVSALPNLKLRGLMCIPAKKANLEAQRATFAALAGLLHELKHSGFPQLDTLSMGMSNDMEAAIAEGATIVRIGTALFGERHQ